MQLISQSGHTTYGLKEFVLVNEDEIKNLPMDCLAGSTAFIISSTKCLMFDGTDWREI